LFIILSLFRYCAAFYAVKTLISYVEYVIKQRAESRGL